jgi:heat shock protein HspQ
MPQRDRDANQPAERQTGRRRSQTLGGLYFPAQTRQILQSVSHKFDDARMDKPPHPGLGGGVKGPIRMLKTRAKYTLGQVVKHRKHPFRGVIFDVDPEFSNTEEWYDAIPEGSRPSRAQPFYHLLAENDQSYYVAYVSEQNLEPDRTGEPVDHPELEELFGDFEDGRYPLEFRLN